VFVFVNVFFGGYTMGSATVIAPSKKEAIDLMCETQTLLVEFDKCHLECRSFVSKHYDHDWSAATGLDAKIVTEILDIPAHTLLTHHTGTWYPQGVRSPDRFRQELVTAQCVVVPLTGRVAVVTGGGD
jgi:hypothetical protein